MKKTYIIPSTIVMGIQATQMLALSLVNGGEADPGAGMETKEDNAWDIWGEVEDDAE